MTQEPRWITKHGLLRLVEISIANDGGIWGVRDEGLLDSALARPANRHLYEGLTDLSALAATYLAAVAGNHPFLDGNKRAGFIAMGLFLAKNGLIFTADETDAALKVFAFAAGEIGVEDLTVWIAGNVEPA